MFNKSVTPAVAVTLCGDVLEVGETTRGYRALKLRVNTGKSVTEAIVVVSDSMLPVVGRRVLAHGRLTVLETPWSDRPAVVCLAETLKDGTTVADVDRVVFRDVEVVEVYRHAGFTTDHVCKVVDDRCGVITFTVRTAYQTAIAVGDYVSLDCGLLLESKTDCGVWLVLSVSTLKCSVKGSVRRNAVYDFTPSLFRERADTAGIDKALSDVGFFFSRNCVESPYVSVSDWHLQMREPVSSRKF